jgi:hypothetical protein
VCSGQTDFLAFMNCEGCLIEQQIIATAYSDVLKVKHGGWIQSLKTTVTEQRHKTGF